MRDVDVIVLGAGISGCIAAALLARNGYQVVLISRDAGTTHHLPESWIYNHPESIHSLGIEKKILSALKQQSRCVFCSSDNKHGIEIVVKNDKEEIQQGDVVWVERNQLDNILLNAALEEGVFFQPFSRIVDCHVSDLEVNLCVESQKGQSKFRAPYIIDATGKTAFLSHHLGLPVEERKLDSRMAYFSHFELQSEIPKEMRIIHISGGYLFCIPLSGQRLSVGCVIAENLIKPNISSDEIFNEALLLSSYMTALTTHSKRVLPVITAKNSQRICIEPSGQSYRLIGEAAAFLDPFFCSGIDFAFFSAEQAVETIKQNTHQNYKSIVMKWLEKSKLNVYEKLEKSDWNSIIRLFADPHLPWAVPLILTQAFGQSVLKEFSFREGIHLAREAYELASR